MSAWRSCGRWNFTSCMFLLSLNRIFQASERSSRKSRCRKTEQRRSGRRDVAQRSSGSLIEVTDHKMLVGLIDPNEPAILPQIRKLMRTRHYAARTERSYTVWAWRFAHFAGGWDKLASTVIESEVRDFLSKLAVKDRVAASTQNQALNALLFLFRDVLGHDFAGTQFATGIDPTVTRTGSDRRLRFGLVTVRHESQSSQCAERILLAVVVSIVETLARSS